jgi:hypothetical protein
MVGVQVTATECVSDGHYPDWLLLSLIDAHGREWLILEKVPVVTLEDLNEYSVYPRKIVIACREVARRMTGGRELVLIDLNIPWGIQATDGTTHFEVCSNQLCAPPC